jgi:hypothetical protein
MYLMKEGELDPLIALNHETSPGGSFLGMHDFEKHINLGPTDFHLPFSAFVRWAIKTAYEYLAKEEGYSSDNAEAEGMA